MICVTLSKMTGRAGQPLWNTSSCTGRRSFRVGLPTYIEEIAGNRAKARELYLAGQKNWPDELDFRSGEIRLKKKKG